MSQRVTIEDVAEVVADLFGVGLGRLRGPGRDWEICAVRGIAFALAREMTGHSLPQIGRYFGRDHTTVLNGLRRYQATQAEQDADRIAEARQRIAARVRPVFVRSADRAVFRSVRGVA